jgi:hypothetical protein
VFIYFFSPRRYSGAKPQPKKKQIFHHKGHKEPSCGRAAAKQKEIFNYEDREAHESLKCKKNESFMAFVRFVLVSDKNL